MVYENIDSPIQSKLNPINARLTEIEKLIDAKTTAYHNEDSKRREQELKDAVRSLRSEQRTLWGQQSQMREEVFKDLLSKEYDVPRDHPKFEKAYALAYSQGHSSGWSEIENYFSELADLIR